MESRIYIYLLGSPEASDPGGGIAASTTASSFHSLREIMLNPGVKILLSKVHFIGLGLKWLHAIRD